MHELHPWMRKAVVRRQPNGVVVQVPHNRPAVWKAPDGTTWTLRKSEKQQQFFLEND